MDEMLTANNSVLFLFMFLLPGFLGVLVYGFLQEGKPIPNFDRVVMAFALALISGLVVEGTTLVTHAMFGTPILGVLPTDMRPVGGSWGGLTSMYDTTAPAAPAVTPQEILFSMVNLSLALNSIVSILIGSTFGLLNKTDVIYSLVYKILNHFHLSNKISNNDVWADVFLTMRGYWVRLEFKDGRTLTGWPKYYSKSGDPRELFLADATWSNASEDKPILVDIEGPGVYIADFDEVQSIEILS